MTQVVVQNPESVIDITQNQVLVEKSNTTVNVVVNENEDNITIQSTTSLVDVTQNPISVVTSPSGVQVVHIITEGPQGPPGDSDSTPVDTQFTYNVDGTLATIIKGGVTLTFTYLSGVLSQITNGDWVKSFSYNLDGSLDEILVT